MINLEELSYFLIRSRRAKLVCEEKKKLQKNDGCTLFSYSEEIVQYSSESTGFFMRTETEIIRKLKEPIWTMSCNGGMLPSHHENKEFTKKTYTFLKQALSYMHVLEPYRGPQEYKEKEFEYFNFWEGNMAHFTGKETISECRKVVYEQKYIGGLII